MFEDEWPGLLAMALSATLVHPRHGQAAAGFHDVRPVRVVALHTIHPLLKHRMMLRQIEFGVRLQMALKACFGIVARIDDEPASSSTAFNVFAPGPMAGFAAGLPGKADSLHMHSSMRAGRKHSRDVGMAIQARFIAYVSRPGHLGRSDNGSREGGTGDKRDPG